MAPARILSFRPIKPQQRVFCARSMADRLALGWRPRETVAVLVAVASFSLVIVAEETAVGTILAGYRSAYFIAPPLVVSIDRSNVRPSAALSRIKRITRRQEGGEPSCRISSRNLRPSFRPVLAATYTARLSRSTRSRIMRLAPTPRATSAALLSTPVLVCPRLRDARHKSRRAAICSGPRQFFV